MLHKIAVLLSKEGRIDDLDEMIETCTDRKSDILRLAAPLTALFSIKNAGVTFCDGMKVSVEKLLENHKLLLLQLLRHCGPATFKSIRVEEDGIFMIPERESEALGPVMVARLF